MKGCHGGSSDRGTVIFTCHLPFVSPQVMMVAVHSRQDAIPALATNLALGWQGDDALDFFLSSVVLENRSWPWY